MMEIFDCAQNSPEWFAARCGIVTASNLACLMTTRGDQKGRATYMRKLAAEIVTGEPGESFSRPELERGHEMEAEVRNLYAFQNDVEPQLVGFIKNGKKGCSPDSLIGDVGMLEIKTKRADLLIDTLLKDEFPNEHRAQVQGQLWIAEREWCDLSVYWPKMPSFVKRAYRDEAYIKELSSAVDLFNSELYRMVETVRQYAG